MQPTFTRAYAVFPSAARATHVASTDENTNGYTGLTIDIDITAFTGTSITFTVQAKDPVAGTYSTLLASAALAAPGHTVLIVDPRVPAVANASAQRPLPKQWRIVPSGTITSVTYSVGATYSL